MFIVTGYRSVLFQYLLVSAYDLKEQIGLGQEINVRFKSQLPLERHKIKLNITPRHVPRIMQLIKEENHYGTDELMKCGSIYTGK